MTNISLEQKARDLLEQVGYEDAQSLSAGDVVLLAELFAENYLLRELLREYLASPLDRAPDLDKRAREALGDD